MVKDSRAGNYLHEDNVTLTASPNPGYIFNRWDGDYNYLADRFSATNSFQMPSSSISLTPLFSPIEHTLDTVTVGEGTITVSWQLFY